MKTEEVLKLIKSFEAAYKEAGNFAYKIQKGIKKDQKTTSGILEIDTITEADLAVQEMVLKEWSKSPLKNCHLIAEEKTPSTKLFTGVENFFITIDPIDGTSLYANGEKYFSLIIGLHNSKEPLYTFIYFPSIDWTHTMVGNQYLEEGEKPTIDMADSAKTIIYSYGDPEKTIPKTYKQYTDLGYVFRTKKMISKEAGSTALFLMGNIDGYYCENPIAVDGLVILHYAMTQNYKIIKSSDLNLANYFVSAHDTIQHKGNYLVIKK